MSMEYVTAVTFDKHIGRRFADIRNRKGAYKRYLRLVRLLQEKGIPVKPVNFDMFEERLKGGKFGSNSTDFSGLSKHVAKIDPKRAFFSAMAAQIVAAPYASMVGGGYTMEKEHAADFLTALRPEDIPRAVGEVHKRALKDEFAKETKAPPSELDKIPELVEEATKVLEEYFGGDPKKAVDYTLDAEWEEASEQELEREYRDLLFRADNIFREWIASKKTVAGAVKELKPPKAVNIILSKLEAVREQAEWIGGVDLRVLKKILYDVGGRKELVVEALRLVKEWEKGDKEAFFEDYLNLKSLPEVELEDLGLIGDLERLRRSVATGSLKPIDVVNILTALYTIYSLTESYLVRFLSNMEEYAEGEHGLLRIKPEKLGEYVLEPLKERLRRIRPIIRGDFEI